MHADQALTEPVETHQHQGLLLRPFEAQDIAGVHHLVERCFGPIRPIEGDVWRFVDTPAGVIPGMVALDGTRIVASYTAWPITLSLGGEIVQGAQSMDTMTDPDYRGRGLFVTLATASYALMARRGYDVLYGFPNDSSFPGFMRRLAWSHVGDVTCLKRVLPPVPAMFDPVSLVSVGMWHSRLHREAHWDVSDDAVAIPILVALATAQDGNKIHLRRDEAWFRWRYSSASQHHYRMITAGVNGTAHAAVVYREDGNRGVIAETLGGNGALQTAVWQYLKLARQRGIRVVTALTTDPESVEVLRSAGFWFRGQEHFIVKRLSTLPLKIDPFVLDNWTLFGGDHDVY